MRSDPQTESMNQTDPHSQLSLNGELANIARFGQSVFAQDGGPGFSVPMGLLLAGVSVPAWFMKLLPKWVAGLGLALAVCGELSWLNLVAPQALFLIPLTRFPSFIWLIATGFMLPRGVTRAFEARKSVSVDASRDKQPA